MHLILIIEDDDDLRGNLATLLSTLGYAVKTAAHGAEALSLLRTEPAPRVILLDLMMPRMDGWMFRKAQLADPSIAEIPVILMTAFSHPSGLAALQVDTVLRKPFDIDRLLQALQAHGATSEVRLPDVPAEDGAAPKP